MSRHIYTLIVDCPEPSEAVSGLIGKLADTLFNQPDCGTRDVSLGVIVPHDDGFGLHPVVRLVERTQ